jgi:hypothetical protein
MPMGYMIRTALMAGTSAHPTRSAPAASQPRSSQVHVINDNLLVLMGLSASPELRQVLAWILNSPLSIEIAPGRATKEANGGDRPRWNGPERWLAAHLCFTEFKSLATSFCALSR